MKLTLILEPEAPGANSVVRPAISGCVSKDDSLEVALVSIRGTP